MNLFDPDLAPFTIALMVMGFILVFEVAGALFGAPASELLDKAFPNLEADGPDGAPGLLSWLYVGRAPLLILLAAFLMAFGISGLVIQAVASSLLGFHLWSWAAAIPAIALALPFTRVVGRFFSRVLRQEASDAVSSESFIGKIAVVIRGEARKGFPAEAKLRDLNGALHYVLVEPEEDDAAFPRGSEVLLVERSGAVFRAVMNPSRALSAG